VEVHTDSGLVGLGETYAGVYAPELIAPITEFISPLILGLNPLDPEAVAIGGRIPFLSRNGLFCSVYSAIDIALWDIAGQFYKKPIHELLYPANDHRVKAYASGGSAAKSSDEVQADAILALEKGFSGFKMRVGVQSWKDDLKRIAAAKQALGSTHLMIDAIMGTVNPPWDLNTAKDKLFQMADFNPYWLEEPLHPDFALEQRKLKGLTQIKIASGEALTGWLDFTSYLSVGAVDIIQVDPTHCGGITLGRKIIELAAQMRIPTAMHVWGSSVAYAANAHLAFSHPSVEWLEVPMVSLELSEKVPLISEKIGNNSFSGKPIEPGLGVSFSSEIKEKYKLVPGSGYKI
jgi:L-alanine-DL-glutamate epimerase-like enolase superfamily enzyme